MGMFDKPQYLTGKEGYVQVGDTFWIHNAKVDGTVTINGNTRDQVKLLVSHERDSERESVFTSGAGIVGQVRRMSAEDRQNFPIEVRLDAVPSRQGNDVNVLTPASEEPPSAEIVPDESSF